MKRGLVVCYMAHPMRGGAIPVVPSGDLLDAVADVLARVESETNVSVRADLLAHTRSTVDGLFRGELSAEQAIAALAEAPPESGIQRRR